MTKIKIRIFIALYCLFFILFGVTLTYAQTAQEIAQKTFRSTVLLVMEDSNGQPLSLGSGFFVGNGEIATNLHVVKGAAGGYAKLMGEKTKYDIEGVTAVDPKRDLVILKIANVRSQALSIGNSDAVQVGEPIFVVGNPKGLEGTFSQGIISSIRKIGSDKILQITAPISPGSSGGPVLNKSGKVIGVSVATFKGGQNLNFAIPSSYLKTLLSKKGTVKPLAKSKKGKTQRSILSDIGGRSTEGITGGNFIWDNNPHNPYIRNQGFTFSIRNHLRSSVSNVSVLIIFYDRRGLPLDVIPLKFSNLIPAKLAKRVRSSADYSIKKMTTSIVIGRFKDSPDTKIEFRILDFKIAE